MTITRRAATQFSSLYPWRHCTVPQRGGSRSRGIALPASMSASVGPAPGRNEGNGRVSPRRRGGGTGLQVQHVARPSARAAASGMLQLPARMARHETPPACGGQKGGPSSIRAAFRRARPRAAPDGEGACPGGIRVVGRTGGADARRRVPGGARPEWRLARWRRSRRRQLAAPGVQVTRKAAAARSFRSGRRASSLRDAAQVRRARRARLAAGRPSPAWRGHEGARVLALSTAASAKPGGSLPSARPERMHGQVGALQRGFQLLTNRPLADLGQRAVQDLVARVVMPEQVDPCRSGITGEQGRRVRPATGQPASRVSDERGSGSWRDPAGGRQGRAGTTVC